MDAISYPHARNHLADTMEKVCVDHVPVIITRTQQRSVMMIFIEDYQALEQTAYLIRSPQECPSPPGIHGGTGIRRWHGTRAAGVKHMVSERAWEGTNRVDW
jgi:antitoxin YefM